MSASAAVQSVPVDAASDAVMRKVFRRLMWFLFVLLIISFIDRINVAFAGLSMNKDLGLTASMFGMAITLFYIGYFLCEIPSNLLLARFGAKIWIARIMITWGIASAGTMFATGEWSLYFWRALTGIAEAGFLPGVLLYLTYWFPRSYRARASALFIMGIPTAIAVASLLSGMILQMDGILGLAGWRWLFLLEGLPAVIFGVAAYFYLTDRPAHAGWLTDAEKATLEARMRQDRALEEQTGTAKGSVMRELMSPNVILLCVAYFGLVSSLNANATWTPQVVRGFAGGASFFVIGIITAVPAVLTLLAMPFWGKSSDRRKERPWHVRIPMLVAVAGWLCVIGFSNPGLKFLGLTLVSVGSYCGMLTFWTLPANAAILSPAARPAGIALINSVGIGGGSAIGPLVVGFLKDWSGSFTPGFLYVIAMLLMGVVCITALAGHERVAAAAAAPSRA
jgi:ACS family 4-hydroxyphenylacetate permease-like MFS transporter